MIIRSRTPRPPYPVVSIFGAIALLAYFYLQTQVDLREFYGVPADIFERPLPEALLILFGIVAWLEMRYVQRQRRRQIQENLVLKQQLDDLRENKKQLNAKAHVYANHADKLKLFISDKLLEYIEYDEKFLHFKNIASEVRHNGVISYDKVITSLENQLAAVEDTDSTLFSELCEARDSLQYVWDLLDLSTADNIALHIASQVCESEELLFESELNRHDAPLPESPVFDPRRALEKAVARCFGVIPQSVDIDTGGERLLVEDQHHVWIRCHQTPPLLGNENHIVLALENLINNAQFFAGRISTKRRLKNARIAIELNHQDRFIGYRVYNRGQTIDDETAGKLFQLGFSTRRVREHHGKGLGLYFVNEIIKGYDGSVRFRNIHNRTDVLSLRLEFATGEVVTDVIEWIERDGGLVCRKSGEEADVASLSWDFYGSPVSLEITHQSDQQTHRITAFEKTTTVLDPGSPRYPRWQLDIDCTRGASTHMHFAPVDITGVEFSVRLPTLTARLEGDLLTIDEEAMERQVANLTDRFRSLEE